MQGYNRSKLVVGGEKHEFRQGFFRFKPGGSKLEFIRSTDNNTWGLGTSEEGLVFGSTANRNPSVFMPIANRYYEAVRGWAPSLELPTIADSYLFQAATDKVRQVDHFGGYTAARRPRAVHGPPLSAGILEPHGLRLRADRPPGRHVRVVARRRRLSLVESLQPVGQRRRMDGADHGRSRARRQRVGHRLVQLHRAAQSDARRFQDRQGSSLRDRAARQDATAASTAWFTMAAMARRAHRLAARWPGPRANSWSRRCMTAICFGGGTRSGCWSSAAGAMSCRRSSN